jgi:hypothetical protein
MRMADIGVLPTKTTIRLTSSTGDSGTITGATRAAAGIMTADQAARLDDLWGRAEGDGGAIQILPPLVRPVASLPVDAVTRAEMRQALSALKGDVINDAGKVLTQIRQETTPGQAPASLDNARIERLEQALLNVADRVSQLEQTVGQIGAAIEDTLRGQAA